MTFPDQGSFLAAWQPGVPAALVRPCPWPDDLSGLLDRLRPHGAALLESLGGPPDISRYSILAWTPEERAMPSRAPEQPGDEAARALEAHLSSLPGPAARRPEPPHDRWPFYGGWLGYLSFDLGRALERLPSSLPPDDLPPARFLEAPAALVCDHARHEAVLVTCLEPGPTASDTWTASVEALDRLEAWLSPSGPDAVVPPDSGSFRLLEPLESAFTPAEYQQAVARAREYVHAGDLFQVNISQRFSARCDGDPLSLYHRLRAASPAPFAAWIDFGDLQILSSSPERYLLRDGDRIETRPIKGTARRGADEAEDRRLAEMLRVDPKERAEHVMIVDLERNDLGRLAAPDSVRVSDLLRVERYPQVLHLVSTVEARLPGPVSLWDLVAATFPGGSISGAPKVRALEVIEELERSRRGIYTGAIGYVSRTGRMDFNLAIRTLVVRDGRLHLQVGGGIVADSQPLREYEETLLKARGMRRAIEREDRP